MVQLLVGLLVEVGVQLLVQLLVEVGVQLLVEVGVQLLVQLSVGLLDEVSDRVEGMRVLSTVLDSRTDLVEDNVFLQELAGSAVV